jgi:pimeloyl-ACP methyl ester carboxylesterase
MGHSFGGSTILHLAVDYPDVLGGLVLLDSGVRSAAARAAELKAVYDDPDPQALNKFLAARMRSPYDPPADAKRPRLQGAPEHVIKSMQKTVLGFDAAAAAASVKLPALFLLATKPFTDAETLARLGPNWLVGQVVGSGHSIQTIVPEQVNAMVDRFIAIHWRG